MSARALSLCALLLATTATEEIINDDGVSLQNERGSRGLASSNSSPRGCLYKGRWHAPGQAVVDGGGGSCLRCACNGGALACARRACRPLPDPPPPRCHLLHRKGACCPELHCPDGVMMSEQGASARLDDDYPDLISPHSLNHACVEGGTVYSAGSAMESHTACEQCFCLRGARRCVRPRCLPPPRGCAPRPAPGVCCPQRYYCQHDLATHSPVPAHNDCIVDKVVIPEGHRVLQSEVSRNCTQCFCLRGAVRCQPLACAPPLLGCTPRLRPGECCAHQYHCHHTHKEDVYFDTEVATANLLLGHNGLSSVNDEDRSFHTARTTKYDASIAAVSTATEKESETKTTTKEDVISNKVKRKTNEPAPVTKSQMLDQNIKTTKTTKLANTQRTTTPETTTPTEQSTEISEELTESERTSTDLPEATVKILINGTINCSTEISSTFKSENETKQIIKESMSRIPSIDRMDIEEHTFDPSDIITDRHVNGDFDENETFTINVTSSLSTNNSQSTNSISKPGVVTDLKVTINSTKKTKEDYDYDYMEPTLPPSLPNLKIIPFVAADAVVDDDEVVPKDTYPVLEREDKFPVYYPKVEKDVTFATRRQDVYKPSNYPTYSSGKVDPEYEPPLIHGTTDDSLSSAYPNIYNDLSTLVHEYKLSASLGRPLSDSSKSVTKTPMTTFEIKKPQVNLFSPPVETEGGFIPKGPGIIDEYYAVYPSTPSPHIPHLTTSMQLDTEKADCTSNDGRRISEGDSMTLSCSVCLCAWGELHCSPRPCLTRLGCWRRPATTSSADLCCGDLVCDLGNKTTTATKPLSTTEIPITTMTTSAAPNKETPPNIKIALPADILFTKKASLSTVEVKTVKETTTESVSKVTEIQEDHGKEIIIPTTTTIILRPSIIENSTKADITTAFTTLEPLTTTKLITTDKPVTNEYTTSDSSEYEDDEEEDEDDGGFSFGNVLKLLLSESYDATTEAVSKKKVTAPSTRSEFNTKPLPVKIFSPSSIYPSSTTKRPYITHPTSVPTYKSPSLPNTSQPMTTRIPPPYLSVAPFVPLPPQRPSNPPKKHIYPSSFPPTSVNRIDHLVLGEATAIKRTTMRPVLIAKPFTTSSRPHTAFEPTITRKPLITSRLPEVTTKKEVIIPEMYNSITNDVITPTSSGPALSGSSMGVGGLLKLAGCNIYGRMYRVGRIIAELSTPCQECRCTELGVQCKPLSC